MAGRHTSRVSSDAAREYTLICKNAAMFTDKYDMVPVKTDN